MEEVQVLPDWSVPGNRERIEKFFEHYGFSRTETLIPGQIWLVLYGRTDGLVMAEIVNRPTGLTMVTYVVFRGLNKLRLEEWAELLRSDLTD